MSPQQITLILLAAGGLLLPVAQSSAQQSELPPSHSVRPQLYATGFESAEGLVVDGDGNLYAGNYRRNGTIGRVTTAGEASIWRSLDGLAPPTDLTTRPAGLKIDGEGRLIIADAGAGRLLRITASGSDALVLADRGGLGRFVAPRNLALDTAGNVYFTDPGDVAANPTAGVVYRYDIHTDKVDLLADNLRHPTGLAVTPDQRQLCLAEAGRFRLLIFDLAADKSLANQRVLIDFPRQDEGGVRGGDFAPSGMVFDAQGRLYVCMLEEGLINVVDVAAGRLVRQYDAGGKEAVDCHFHENDLYTTIRSKEAVFRLPLNTPGFIYNRSR